MTKKDFDNLNSEQQKKVLKTYELIEKHPVSYEDLENFTHCIEIMAKHGDDLKKFLVGIYPPYGMQKLKYNIFGVYKMSVDSLNFVNSWYNIMQEKIWEDINDR